MHELVSGSSGAGAEMLGKSEPQAYQDLALARLRERFDGIRSAHQTQLGYIHEAESIKFEEREGMHPIRRRIAEFGDIFSNHDTRLAELEEEIAGYDELIAAVDSRNLNPVSDYLASSVEQYIGMARFAVGLTEDRSIERIWVERAAQEIDLLRAIDPPRAASMTAKLENKTGNPLNKF